MENPEYGIIENGIVECIYEPRGDYGLEGYQCGEKYFYKYKKNKDGKKYYGVNPNDKLSPAYWETCSARAFNKCFKIITQVKF